MMKRYDELVMKCLLDRYENSLLSRGTNTQKITIRCSISRQRLPEYFDETSTVYTVIHDQLAALEERGLISLVWRGNKEGHILSSCILNTDMIEEAYLWAGRRSKAQKEAELIGLCRKVMQDECGAWLDAVEETGFERTKEEPCLDCSKEGILRAYLNWICTRASKGESLAKYVDLDDLEGFSRHLKLLKAILNNRESCFLREFSIRTFQESKLAEKEIGRACRAIAEFSKDKLLKDAETDDVMAEYGIYRNPSWIMMKGEGCLELGVEVSSEAIDRRAGDESETAERRTEDESEAKEHKSGSLEKAVLAEETIESAEKKPAGSGIIHLQAIPGGMAITDAAIPQIRWYPQDQPLAVLTIENLTSFHRWSQESLDGRRLLVIYLGGYANQIRRCFLKKIEESFPGAIFYHFGDIDCGGFKIWKNLTESTGIKVQPMGMDLMTYKENLKTGRPLTDSDRSSLKKMLQDPFFAGQKELFERMLKEDIKLEQEGIRWESS